MRKDHNQQTEFGNVPIASIEVDKKSRDDIPKTLIGLQLLYRDDEKRAKMFALLVDGIPPEGGQDTGRSGMELWQILVMGLMNQALDRDRYMLHSLVNHYDTIRAFLGHGVWGDETFYEYETVEENLSLLTPELIAEACTMILQCGHRLPRTLSKLAKKS